MEISPTDKDQTPYDILPPSKDLYLTGLEVTESNPQINSGLPDGRPAATETPPQVRRARGALTTGAFSVASQLDPAVIERMRAMAQETSQLEVLEESEEWRRITCRRDNYPDIPHDTSQPTVQREFWDRFSFEELSECVWETPYRRLHGPFTRLLILGPKRVELLGRAGDGKDLSDLQVAIVNILSSHQGWGLHVAELCTGLNVDETTFLDAYTDLRAKINSKHKKTAQPFIVECRPKDVKYVALRQRCIISWPSESA